MVVPLLAVGIRGHLIKAGAIPSEPRWDSSYIIQAMRFSKSNSSSISAVPGMVKSQMFLIFEGVNRVRPGPPPVSRLHH